MGLIGLGRLGRVYARDLARLIPETQLTAVADTIVARNFRSFEVYLVVTGLYLAMSLAFQAAFAAIHRALFARWGGA